MPADRDERLLELLPLAGPRSGQDAELDRHGVRCDVGGGVVTSMGRRSSTIRSALRYTTYVAIVRKRSRSIIAISVPRLRRRASPSSRIDDVSTIGSDAGCGISSVGR